MFPNPFGRSAPIAPAAFLPNSTSITDPDARKQLVRAELLGKTIARQVQQMEKPAPNLNPFVRAIYHLAPSVIPNEEQARRIYNERVRRLGQREAKNLATNYGLVATEAMGVPRDVVLSHIAPFLQPSSTQIARRRDKEYVEGLADLMDFPTDVPPVNANMSPFAPAGSIPNLGF